jgi:aminocarboxymuconate-semialdehyde decarboxylase
MVIDIHTHFFPDAWPDLADRYGTPDWPRIRHLEGGEADILLGDRFFRRINSACWDVERRIQDLDRDGIDLQIISPMSVLSSYARPVEHALDMARLFNDAALELCSRSDGRMKSLCRAPLQDIDAACGEISRSMQAGHLGVKIGDHIGLKNLDEPGMITFLHHCADVGAAVLVNPWDMMAGDCMTEDMMPWTVGMPAETQLLVAMIEGGAFDRLPHSLRICFAHGGGSLPFLLGRMQNAWEHLPVARSKSELPPKQYVDRFFVDSAVFDDRTLQFLVNIMGPDQVVLGSDYPFPLGEERPGTLVRTAGLPLEVKAKVLGGNAERFLGLDRAAHPPEMKSVPLLNYSRYLHVTELLDLQDPQSSPPHHDELLFIIVHQVYELWFKELLHDLDEAAACLKAFTAAPGSLPHRPSCHGGRGSEKTGSEGEHPGGSKEVYEAARMLRRCTEIMRVLVDQFTILETMLPTHFLAFRGKLDPASGFQSEQFREIEFLCGQKDETLLRDHAPDPEAYAKLMRRLREPSLRDVFFQALGTISEPPGTSGSKEEEHQARVQVIRDLYQSERQHRDWIDVCERLIEFDELFMGWRLRHIQLVERMIGTRTGTGGHAGSMYLRQTLDKKFFPELWEARSILQGE